MNKTNVTIKILISLIFFVLNYNMAFANWPDHVVMVDGYQMMGTDMGWMMLLFWGLVLGILLLVIHWVLSLPQRENQLSKMQKNAMEILKDRFANGEIDITEFEFKKQIITG